MSQQIKMSFEVDTSEQEITPEAPPQQQVVTKKVIQRKITKEEKEELQKQARESGSILQFEQKTYSPGIFGHIKDNMDSQNRYDIAFNNMARRAPKAGDQFDVERKLEKRYDDDEKLGTPQRVTSWILNVLKDDISPPAGMDWKQLQTYYKDGVILCKLLNKLLRQAEMKPIGYRLKANQAFVAINNLEKFLEGAKTYGVPKESLFVPVDLQEGRKGTLSTFFVCLNALGCVANARGFQPPYEETAPPKAEYCRDECYE